MLKIGQPMYSYHYSFTQMTIRLRSPLRVLLPVLLATLNAGPSAAESSLNEPIVEHSALPPPGISTPAPDTPIQRPPEPTSSMAGDGLSQPPAGPGPHDHEPFIDHFSPAPGLARPPANPRSPEYPVASNRRVQYFLDRFTGTRREVIERWLDRSTRYLHMVRDVFRQKGIPEDLAYTAMIESGFDPTAVSRVGAKGLWQFMARTARSYGLRVDHWVDERLDPEKSTNAAAAYLRDLHNQFGSWLLAQAAYNAGDAKVTRAIRLTRTNDFWELARTRHLRSETKDFVPAIQAMTVIARDPDQFGFEVGSPEARRFDTIRVPPLTDLRRLSHAAGVPFESIRDLNLELWRSVTPPRAPYVLKVPEGTHAEIRQALQARVRVARIVLSPRGVHVVRPKDTVSGIARKYGLSVTDILRWNQLAQRDRIRPGDRIRIARLDPEAYAGQGGFR